VADDYVGQREFYYPHTVDFRGRAYPLHPSLHHLGDDLCRGLLSFGRGRPLGPHGLDWLYVHLANVWGNGQDKLSYDGRRCVWAARGEGRGASCKEGAVCATCWAVSCADAGRPLGDAHHHAARNTPTCTRSAFARQHLGTILDVALDPLANTWWQDGEAPWQTLAACCEVAAALESTHPASFVSHLPVHMDGSCNGLQHYAALGRDEAGGTAVNLVPSDTPQDVYKVCVRACMCACMRVWCVSARACLWSCVCPKRLPGAVRRNSSAPRTWPSTLPTPSTTTGRGGDRGTSRGG
jgi:DNA-directed RNA polymerase